GTADVLRLKIDGVAAIVTSAWSNIYHTGMKFGLAGTATGAWTMDGATSGVVTMTVAATAGTWTMTLPATAGTSGYFLVSNGSGVTSWSNTLTSPTINGTIATTGLTMPAFNSGTISLGSNDHIISNYGSLISHVSDTDNINLCGGTDTNGGYIVLTGKSHASLPGRVTIYTPNAALSATTRVTFLGAADTTAITWGNSYHTGMKFGLAGTATGAFTMDGATSGVLTVTVPAATTSYTLTLPAAANTNAGYQLTCAGADTITSWAAAASKREYKNILGLADPQTSLDLILNTKTYKFHYKPGMGTGDVDTEYVGFVAEERPEFTHYKNGVLNPINTFGHTALAIQALNNRIEELEKQVIILSGR
ncbi:MAG: hypothetical protein Q7K41_05785, partial [Dehalococcoidales bacterium]|nr:hypothetical protein [Dehalococcoidales bacterium]